MLIIFIINAKVTVFPRAIGSAREWFEIANFVINSLTSLITAYDLKTLFVESFRVRRPLRRNSEVKLIEKNTHY